VAIYAKQLPLYCFEAAALVARRPDPLVNDMIDLVVTPRLAPSAASGAIDSPLLVRCVLDDLSLQ
jgi:hypothetical protein